MSNSVVPCGRTWNTTEPSILVGADNHKSTALSLSPQFEPSTEIMRLILDAVDNPYSSDAKATWNACSLASPRWRSVSQAYLLRDIQIGNNLSQACHFFETTPWLAVHVRRLRTVSYVDIHAEELERLLDSLVQLRTLHLSPRTHILCKDEALQQEPRPGHHRLDLLECTSFGMGPIESTRSELCSLLSIFSDIKEVRIIDLRYNPSVAIQFDRDSAAVAAARQPATPTIQSILLRGFPLVIPTALFLRDIGALRCLRELVIDATSTFGLVGIIEVLRTVGTALERLSIHLDTARLDKSDPCDGFLPLMLRAGLTTCSSLREFRLHLLLSYFDPDSLSVTSAEALGLCWSMVADSVALVPVSHLRQLHLKFFHIDYTDSEVEWHDVHSLSWNKMRKVCDAFPCLESVGISITQPPKLKDPARHRRLQDCVKYEMQKYRGMLIEEEESEYAFTAAGCEDDGCKQYNGSLIRNLQ